MGYRHISSATSTRPSQFVIDDHTVASVANRHAFICCMSTWSQVKEPRINAHSGELELVDASHHEWRFDIEDIHIAGSAVVVTITSDNLVAIQQAWDQHYRRLLHNRGATSQRLNRWQVPQSSRARRELIPYR